MTLKADISSTKSANDFDVLICIKHGVAFDRGFICNDASFILNDPRLVDVCPILGCCRKLVRVPVELSAPLISMVCNGYRLISACVNRPFQAGDVEIEIVFAEHYRELYLELPNGFVVVSGLKSKNSAKLNHPTKVKLNFDEDCGAQSRNAMFAKHMTDIIQWMLALPVRVVKDCILIF